MSLESRLQTALEIAGLGKIATERPGAWLASATSRLSLGLTRDRALAGRPYLNDQGLRSAYVAMFWPVSYLQTQHVLRPFAQALGHVLDIGGGTGASTAAALDAGALSVTIVDHAADALGYCATLFDGEEVHTVCTDAEAWAPRTTYDTVLAVHVINELFGTEPVREKLLLESTLSWVHHLNLDGRLVIIEPALREVGQDLLRLRDALVAHGLYVEAPCFFQGNCPALEANDWCHTSLAWTPPAWMKQLAQDSGLDRSRIKMAYLVVRKVAPKHPEAAPGDSDVARVVSEPLHTKGRLRYIVCGSQGRYPIVCAESRVRPPTEAMRRLPPGSVVRIGPTAPKGDGIDVSLGYVHPMGEPT